MKRGRYHRNPLDLGIQFASYRPAKDHYLSFTRNEFLRCKDSCIFQAPLILFLVFLKDINKRMLVFLAVLSFAVSAHCQAQTTPNQQIVSTQSNVVNRLVPVTSRVVNNGTGVLTGIASPGFTKTILPIISKKNTFAFLGQIKQEPGTDKVGYTFIFGEEAQPTLKSLAVSGSDFTFVGASAILPADQTPTNKPNSEFSATGFVSTDGSATTALVTTQTPSGVVPNVALRFDYNQTAGSPLVSVYYTDRLAPLTFGGSGTAKPNLAQSFGVYIAPDGTVYPGQG
ncbi:hypothetical protein WJX75_000102 [Coccomyxa subellipsoidea]|uniref:Uncharacterized protein n=1 Tax=Coccomyxa subellipsoidea TaxID=248742 RepID=A0ABR2Z174_9CHLO